MDVRKTCQQSNSLFLIDLFQNCVCLKVLKYYNIFYMRMYPYCLKVIMICTKNITQNIIDNVVYIMMIPSQWFCWKLWAWFGALDATNVTFYPWQDTCHPGKDCRIARQSTHESPWDHADDGVVVSLISNQGTATVTLARCLAGGRSTDHGGGDVRKERRACRMTESIFLAFSVVHCGQRSLQ